MDDLPSEYDAIVLGTGMTECILAAALARIGYSVLHLDRNDYYSGDWASFHFEALLKWIAQQQKKCEDCGIEVKPANESELLKSGEQTVSLPIKSTSFSHVESFTYVSEGDNDEEKDKLSQNTSLQETPSPDSGEKQEEGNQTETEIAADSQLQSTEKATSEKVEPESENKNDQQQAAKWTYKAIKKQWRKFNLDLAPKVLFCRGSFVELLISSDIAKYCEFKTVTRMLTFLNNKLEQVPCSRSDVFSSKAVSMIEKRMMMKFITFCVEYEKHPEEYLEHENKSFGEFLKARKLTANIQHYILHSIAMVSGDTPTIEGLKSCQLFLKSLGRYGNTAFLSPLYGSGEIPQCFCRMCAVFGGIYCLRRTAVSVILDAENSYTGIIDTEGKRLDSKWLIMDASYAATCHLPEEKNTRKLCRCILLTNKSILSSDAEQITLLNLPATDGESSSAVLYELSSSSSACPKDIYVVHLTTVSNKPARHQLEPVVKQFFRMDNEADCGDDERPQVLWSVYFNCEDNTQIDLNSRSPGKMFVTSGPGMDLDFTKSVEEAKKIFDKICPGEDFLPKAPNPEDIIYDDGDQSKPADPGFQTEEKESEEGNKETDKKENTKSDEDQQCPEEGATSTTTTQEGPEESKTESTVIDS